MAERRDAVEAWALCAGYGPDGEDWNRALADAPAALDHLRREGFVLVREAEVRLALAIIDAEDAWEWGSGATIDTLAARVGFEPVADPPHTDSSRASEAL